MMADAAAREKWRALFVVDAPVWGHPTRGGAVALDWIYRATPEDAMPWERTRDYWLKVCDACSVGTPAHLVLARPIASHLLVPSHRIPSPRPIPSHPIASHPIPSHPIPIFQLPIFTPLLFHTSPLHTPPLYR
jgi:hypothetical protein